MSLLVFAAVYAIGNPIDVLINPEASEEEKLRTIKNLGLDKSLFDQYYDDTNLTLNYVIRYHFYTSIDLNSEKNQLISMDGTKFNLSSKNAVDITDEVISLVSKMYFGEKEFKEFKELKKKLKNKY